MRFFIAAHPFLILLLTLTLLGSGCSESESPPPPISMDQIPIELGKAFASAKGNAKELSDLISTAVQSKDLPKAAMALTALAQQPDLSKKQSQTSAGAAVTVNAALVEAEAKGDKKATEFLQNRAMTK